MKAILKKGDTIKCSTGNEMVKVSCALEREGYRTDFLYEKDGEKGFWITIEKGIRR